ncbi:tRNA adenosine(34) deaminase TadA [Desulfonauticus submarinus]|uniref:tRNA adenosine(34) deaminase TadA n=1 Tax=Desulfonauticus submarinus TaxID=206665 RepID=UPI001F22F3AC|nr:tRNA adenosine(34) deaminase TadA [Desulfonauticus submarinus]
MLFLQSVDYRSLMNQALKEAKKAMQKEEIPVGAVIWDIKQNSIISSAHNLSISLCNPTAHAEILAIEKAAQKIKNYRLTNCILVVTLEPCIMCLGAIVQARLEGVIFGAKDPKSGAICSSLDYTKLKGLNHSFWVIKGVLAKESASLLQHFFRAKRKGEVPKWS